MITTRTVTALLLLALGATAALADEPTEVVKETIDVVGTTPLPGLGTAIEEVPANVQVKTSTDLAAQHPSNIGEYLEHDLGSVSVNAVEGNPFQLDVGFRGFTASPLLGTPQGLSVFQDGVRINEPFGDVVNWDLVPQSAIESIQLVPGSNPAFGLNTLGGALAVYTKSGSQFPGGSLELSGGSFGRKSGVLQWGGNRPTQGGGLYDGFVTAEAFDDAGWAEHNPSRVRQLFGKVGWQDAKTDFDASVTAARNELQDTQTLPLSWFRDDIRLAYNHPEGNTNHLTLLSLKGTHFFGNDTLLGGNGYYRRYRNENLNSDINPGYGELDPQSGEVDLVEGSNVRGRVALDGFGGGLQWARRHGAGQLAVGLTADLARTSFSQAIQDASFTADRSSVGITPFAPSVDAASTTRAYGIFASDSMAFAAAWTLTVSGRYNRSEIAIDDRSGATPSLDGNHRFSRFNPALGVNYNPSAALTLYAAYNEGQRAPTAIELGCADPEAPCTLPNAFAADPPLRAVVAKTIEAGGRGRLGASGRWTAAIYRTDLDDDIAFISSGAGTSNAGFFANVGRTRRQGIELGVVRRWRAITAEARYSFTDATYRSPFDESSEASSSADDEGEIHVGPGDRIPAIPRHLLKSRLAWERDRASAGVSVLASGASYARGDENNQDVNGQVPGYAVVSLDGGYRLARGWQAFVRVDNLLDRRYSTFGVLGFDVFTGPGRTFGPAAGTAARPEQFRGPGAPRGIWAGVRYGFGDSALAAVTGAD